MYQNDIAKKMFTPILLLVVLSLAGPLRIAAQETAFASTMSRKVAALDSASITEYADLAADFSRMASASDADWMAAYYAAFCQIILALGDAAQADQLCNEAETMLDKAESRGGDLSEIACLRSMSATARLLVDKQQRWRTYGAESNRWIAIALEANPENPRACYLHAQNLLYTPASYGGGMEKALPWAEKALSYHTAATISPAYAPHWGESQIHQLLEQCRTQ